MRYRSADVPQPSPSRRPARGRRGGRWPACLALLAFAAAPGAALATAVPGGSLGTATWTSAGGPYVLGGIVTIPKGATLTIEPGVTVDLATFGLVVNGTLDARGTPDALIHLTTTSTTRTWDGVSIVGTQASPNVGSTLANVVLDHGGYKGGSVMLTWAAATLDRVTIENGSGCGLRGYAGGVATITDSTFTGNAVAAVCFDDPKVDPVLAGIAASGNGQDGVSIGTGDTAGTQYWEDAGIPYVLSRLLTVPLGATLLIAPGVVVQSADLIAIKGTLQAVGTPTEPILFTRLPSAPSWKGLDVRGQSRALRNEGSVIGFATIEKATINLTLWNARVHVHDSAIQDATGDGVYAYRSGGTLIERSSFLRNGGPSDYAVENLDPSTVFVKPSMPGAVPDPETLTGPTAEDIIATYDWWGDASGPQAADGCNASGSGARVSKFVLYSPFLTSATQDTGLVTPLGMLNLTLTPTRLFVPIGGSKAWVKVTVRDQDGLPVPGRQVTLSSSIGQAVAGGTTDVKGESFVYVTSTTAGVATLTAGLGASTCEPYRMATTTVTFTTAPDATLAPEVVAPYFSGRMKIGPKPLEQGKTATISATLTNPNDFPIAVEAEFGYAQLGLGLAFGPIGVVTQSIPAKSDGVISTDFVPPLSGHYCVRLHYRATQASTPGALTMQAAGSWEDFGDIQENGDFKRPAVKLQDFDPEKAKKAKEAASDTKGSDTSSFFGDGIGSFLDWLLDVLGLSDKSATSNSARPILLQAGAVAAGGGDSSDLCLMAPKPPHASYTEVPRLTAKSSFWSATPSGAREQAEALWIDRMIDVFQLLYAMCDARQRAEDAAANGAEGWAAQQTAAENYYRGRAGAAFIALADANEAYLATLAAAGVTSQPVTVDSATAQLAQLQSSPLTARAVALMHGLHYTDEAIAALRQALVAGGAQALVGDRVTRLTAMTGPWRDLGEALTHPPLTQGSTPTPGALTVASGVLTATEPVSSTFTVGNPLAARTTINLTVRRVDVPADWMVAVSPQAVTLDPGASATAVLTITPTSPAVQGTVSRVAVEGWAGTELVGGVMIDSLTPAYVAMGDTCGGAGSGAEGATCACAMDCAAGMMCSAGKCLATCDLAAPSCGHAGQTCSSWTGPGGVCSPAFDATASTTDGGGCGCSGGTSGGGAGFLVAAALLLALRRRSRCSA